MGKSAELYKNSPSVKRGEDGKPGISRPSKADSDSMGTGGNPLPTDGDGEMPVHVKQVNDMHERHIQEMKDMHKRHQKEHEKLAADHAGTDAASQSVAAEGAAQGEGV